MRFEAVTYLEWAKAHDHYPHSLGWSFAPQRHLKDVMQDFDLDPRELLLWPDSETAGRVNRLRELIASRFGLPEAHVLPVSSCTQANFLAMAAVLDDQPEDKREVLVENPTYSPLLKQIRSAGGQVRQVTTWSNGRLRPESLRQAVGPRTALVVAANLNNPTGAAMSPDDLAEICDAAANYGAMVLIDEVYRDFITPDKIAPAALCGPNAISTESLSKIHGLTSLKVGWILGPPQIIERAQQIYDHLSVAVPFINRDFAARVLESHWDKIVEDARDFANSRRAIVDKFASTRRDIVWHRPDGGLVGLLEILKVDVDKLARHMLEKYQTVVVPGRFFGIKNAIRLGYGGEGLEQNLINLSTALDEVRDGQATTSSGRFPPLSGR